MLGLVVAEHTYAALPRASPRASWPRSAPPWSTPGSWPRWPPSSASATSCCSAGARRPRAAGPRPRSWPTPSRPSSGPSTSTPAGRPPSAWCSASSVTPSTRAGEEPDDFDHKSRLQELAVRTARATPRYEVEGSGPDHDRTVRGHGVRRLDQCLGTGEGRSKKDAEQAAAQAAWEELTRMPELPEVETIRQDLATRGRRPEDQGGRGANGRSVRRHPRAKQFRALLEGRTIKSVGRLGKYLLLDPGQRGHPGRPPGDERPAAAGQERQGAQAQAHPRGASPSPRAASCATSTPGPSASCSSRPRRSRPTGPAEPGLGDGGRRRRSHPQGHARAGPPGLRPASRTS